jgi:hypothetical protein
VQQETSLGQNNHRGAQNIGVSVYVLLFSFLSFLFLRYFFKYFFIFFSFAAAHKKKTHQVSDFFVQ